MGSFNHPDYLRPEYAIFINGKDSVVSNADPEKQVFSGYSQFSALNKLRIKPGKNIDFVFTNMYSSLSNVPRYDRLIQYKSGKLRYGDWYYGPQVWMLNNLQVSFLKTTGFYDQLKLTAARQDYKESRHDRSFGNISINEQFEKLIIYSANLDFDKKLSGGRDLLYYGAEYVFNDISSTAQSRDIITGITSPAGSRYPNGINRYNSISAYAGYKSKFSEKITLNGGFRYNYVTLHSTIADNSFYNFPFTEIDIRNGALTGSLGVVWKTGEKSRVSVNGSTGFRAPNLDDAGKVFDSAPGVVVVPNPDLKPEYATNFDLGFSGDLGSFLRFDITGFCTWLKNAMVRDDYTFNGEDSIMYGGEMSKVEAVVNASYAIAYGMDIGLRANVVHNFYIQSSLNITEGFEKGGIPLRHATPLFGSTHLVYESAIIKTDLFAVYNGAKRYDDMPPSEISKPYMYATDDNGNPWSPGWITLNFKISAKLLKWAMLNIGIENIFDQRYRPYASGIVSPGRNFIISLRISV
jgi:hemoglobin/transferrin/lactoferrin receptor protein